jgi:3-hydroxybutyryl-CoA dehydrogenase
MSAIRTVGVLGGGLMGSGIAQVSAQAGLRTIVREISEALGERARASIERTLAKGIEKGKVSATERDATLRQLAFTTSIDDLRDCDIVIEAVVEELDVKNALWRELDGVCPQRTIFASNTSSLTIAAMASATSRGDRMVGLHFFNPVPLMKLVEVIRALTTSQETYQALFAFATAVGKEPITAPDKGGFIVNRLLVPYLLDAIRSYEHGLGTIEDIDKGMKLGTGYPMGPFTLLDFVGLDTTYYIANIMFEEYREPAYAPPPLLKRMVLAGRLGKKSGHGFYKY